VDAANANGVIDGGESWAVMDGGIGRAEGGRQAEGWPMVGGREARIKEAMVKRSNAAAKKKQTTTAAKAEARLAIPQQGGQ